MISKTDIQQFLLSLALIVGVLAVPVEQLSAARNEALVDPVASPYELVVVEIEGCRYCPILRRDALPAFEASPVAREVQLRFLDLNTEAAQSIELTEGPVQTVPTLLLLKGNREVGRAEGYLGPDGFVLAARWLLNNAKPGLLPIETGSISTRP